MNTKDAIRDTAAISNMVLKSYIGDLSDGDLLQRPGTGCNHLAWQLGHLISSEVGLMDMIQPGSGPELPAGFKEKHAKEQATNDNPSDFCSKQEYVDLLQKVDQAFQSLLASFPDEDFDKPSPEHLRKMFPTMGALFILIATHPMMHAGQFVPVRRALGKPVLI